MKRILVIAALLASPVLAEDYIQGVVGPFGGLNNADSSLVIPQNMAQDLLNVDITPGGKSVAKRKGYAQAFATTITTSPIHGVYSFYDEDGNDIVLAFNDADVTASISGGNATRIYSTATIAATWQCVDSQGFAYCANSSRNGLFYTRGLDLAPLPVTSTGTMVAVTTERLVQAGFSATPNRIDFSKANDFETWTVGAEPTDPITFTITAPGSRITHIVYAHKKIYWFKESSFGYIIEGDTLDEWTVRAVSNEIGTLDNTSTQDTGGNLYFRGQDGHIYVTDGANVEKLSDDIEETINLAQRRTINSWIQTTEAEFEAGSISASGSLLTDAASGSVMPSSFTAVDDTDAEFNTGTASSIDVTSNRLYLDTNNSGNISNNDFEDGTGTNADNWNENSQWTRVSATPADSCGSGSTAYDGTYFVMDTQPFKTGTITMTVKLASDDSTLTSVTWNAANYLGQCSYYYKYVSAGSHVGKRVYLDFTSDCSGCTTSRLTQTDSFILGGDIGFYGRWSYNVAQTEGYPSIDGINLGSSTITSGSFTSKAFNTGLSQGKAMLSGTWTENDFVPTNVLQQSANGTSGWSDVVASTGVSASFTQSYLRYITTFTVTDTGDALSYASGYTINASTHGILYSDVKNAPSLSSWDAFTASKSDGGGSFAFYIRSATESFTVTSSTPSWTAVSVGGIPSVSTGTYFQIRSDFTINSATNTPTLESFTQTWYEGSATDKSYAGFHDDKVMFSVAYGAGSVANNRLLVYDLVTPGWTLYDLPVNGFYRRNNSLYFGSSSAGYVHKFGDTDNDNGTAIEAYWKSKDFFNDAPFLEKEYVNISVAADQVNNSSMTITYTINGSSSSAYTMALGESNTVFVRNNRPLPLGRVGSTINFKFGNDASDQPFEVFGIGYGYRPKSWRPYP